MSALTPELAIVRVEASLQALLWFAELGKANHGQVVEACLRHAGATPGDPWCAALQSFAGYRGLMTIDPGTLMHTSLWPLRATAGCVDLAEQATKRGVLHTTPERGDLVLVWHASLGRLAHVGFLVAEVSPGVWLTYEGNTIGDPADPMHLKAAPGQGQDPREGWASFPKHRRLAPQDRFVRWAALL